MRMRFDARVRRHLELDGVKPGPGWISLQDPRLYPPDPRGARARARRLHGINVPRIQPQLRTGLLREAGGTPECGCNDPDERADRPGAHLSPPNAMRR